MPVMVFGSPAAHRAAGSAAASSPASAKVLRCDGGGYTIKIPAPVRCGDQLVDQETEARLEMLVDMTTIMADEQSHIMPTHGFLVKRLALKEKQVQVDAQSKFDKLGTLRAVPTDWIVAFLATISDMDKAMLLKIHGYDEDNIYQLLQYATQLGFQLKLPEQCRVKDVLQRVLKSRVAECGDRLDKFVSRGGATPEGKIDWRRGVYSVKFHPTTGKLTSVTHTPTGADVTLDHELLDKTWVLESNFSDYGAAFRKPKMPAIKLASLFPKGVGPLAVPPITARAKQWEKLITTQYAAWEQAVLDTKRGNMKDEVVVEGLKQNASTKRQASMANLRQKAAERIATKKAKLMVSFQDAA